jgi:hypothetical protein
MADLKISALTASTTPLAGTEVLPIVQSSTTKQVSVANLTAGRAVATAALSATGIILTTDATDASSTTAASMKTAGGLAVVKKTYIGDNIVQATAAKGVNFTANTPAAGKTSQLLNWYEEGTWTVSAASSIGTITTIGLSSGKYTRVGNMVTIHGWFNITTNGTGAGVILVSGLPFAISSEAGTMAAYSGCGCEILVTNAALSVYAASAANKIVIANSIGAYPGASGYGLYFSVQYRA